MPELPDITLYVAHLERHAVVDGSQQPQARLTPCRARGTGAGALDPGGIEPLESSVGQLREALLRENHTLKRALTDPRRVSGIGNAYSDEILHRAQLSPMRRSRQLHDEEWQRLHAAIQDVLTGGSSMRRTRRTTARAARPAGCSLRGQS